MSGTKNLVGRLIRLRGVRVHNLKGIDLDLPIGHLIVVTGLSGSGKSSLAFDTLHAEGQRLYVETFSAYTRQFLDRLDKPDADKIEGIPPAIAVGQRVVKRSGRGTVGTVTEIQEAFGLLFARAGQVICHVCGTVVEPATPAIVAKAVDSLAEGERYLVTFPVEVRPETDRAALAESFRDDAFARIRVDGATFRLDAGEFPMPSSGQAEVVVDRLTKGSETSSRRIDSIETAFSKGLGRCRIIVESDGRSLDFLQGRRCTTCGTDYPEPDPRLFRYNSPLGACPTCEGYGSVVDLDLAKIVPDPSKTLREGAIAPWNTPSHADVLEELLAVAPRLKIPLDLPFEQLSEPVTRILVDGAPGFLGLRGFFRKLERKSYKIGVRVFLSRWRGYKTCPDCQGMRLRPEALAVQVLGKNIGEVAALTVTEARRFLERVTETGGAIARRTVEAVKTKLDFLDEIGLNYLTLDRQARTLSDGESRRVSLTGVLGSGLVNMLYVLDEPSIGLHPADVSRLVKVLKQLRDSGNTVVVVEHETEVIRAADQLIEIGPGAGEAGGRVVYQGDPAGIEGVAGSATGDFLSGRKRAIVPRSRRVPTGRLNLLGATGHNLKSVDLSIPLGVFVAVTGVSGAGKSSLIEETLYPALLRKLKNESLPSLPYREFSGAEGLTNVEIVDASPIGRSSRSNPATYLGAFDEIRKTFAATHEAKSRGYAAGTFSFNVAGGRCETCEGSGALVVDMQFLADVTMTCPECRGRRYRPEVLEATYRGKSIAEVLDLTARESLSFFKTRPKVLARLRPLLEVGLDYLRLGQPASTLSGGEAQRLKLAAFLASTPSAMARQAATGSKTLFILDEPTTGLHPADTLKLLEAFDSLLAGGHSLVVVEHHPEVLISADWVVDLGPGAGDAGGRIVASGTPEDVAKADTPTGRVLLERLSM